MEDFESAWSRLRMPNQRVQTNRRPALPLQDERQFDRVSRAQPCLVGGGRSLGSLAQNRATRWRGSVLPIFSSAASRSPSGMHENSMNMSESLPRQNGVAASS